MTGRQWIRGVLPGIVAVTATVTACDNAGPTGVPYTALARDIAGVYNATSTSASADLGMTMVLGTRHTVTGRYEDDAGQVVRFRGTWERQSDRLFITLSGPGLPSEIELDISRETLLTPFNPGPFSQIPENQPLFIEQDVVRLRGSAVVAGVQIDLDLVRVVTDIVGGGGGGEQN